jgi:hypothetical protein
VVIIGVTNEDLDLVDSWVAKKQPSYPIVVVRGKAFDQALGVKGFPTQGVIAPDGTLTYAGYSPEGDFKDAAKQAEKGSLYPKALNKVRKSLKAGSRVDAYAELLELEAGGKVEEADAEWVEKFKVWVEELAADDLKAARAEFEAGRVYTAIALAEPLAESKTAFPSSPDALALMEELEALPTYKKELKGGKAYAGAVELEAEGEYTDAAKKFVSIAKKFDGTRIGDAAMVEAKRLVGDGKPGYKSTCGDCRKQKRACTRHAEKVKI